MPGQWRESLPIIKAGKLSEQVFLDGLLPRLDKKIVDNWDAKAAPADQTEKNFSLSLAIILQLSQDLCFPKNIPQIAAEINFKAFEKRLTRGKTIRALSTAALYLACKISSLPTNSEELVEASDVRRTELNHCSRLLQRELALRIPPPPSVEAYALRILTKLSLESNADLRAEVLNLLQVAERLKLTTHFSPSSAASAAVYVACKNTKIEPMTQKTIARASHLSETSLRKACRKIETLPNSRQRLPITP